MKISIILGAYKSENDLFNVLKHLGSLNYTNYEVLVACDCIEQDLTMLPLVLPTCNWKKLCINTSKKRRGIVKALNSVLKEAKGEIIVHFAVDRRFTRKDALKKIAKHFEDPFVGGILFDMAHPQKRNWSRLAVAQATVVRLVSDWRLEHPIVENDKFPVIVSAFRRIKGIDDSSINDDAEFAYKILDEGYIIKNVKDVKWYAYGEPSDFKKVFNRQKRTSKGWLNTKKRRNIDIKGYYFSLFKYYLKNFKRYSFIDIMLFTMVYSVAMVGAKFSKESITEVWK